MNTLGLRMQLFCAAAGVAVAVFVAAAIGYRTAGGLARQAEHLGTDALPRVKLYLQVARDVETIKAAQRALLAPQLSAAERDRQLGMHAAAVANYTENLTSLAEISNEATDQANLDSVLRALQGWERANESVQQLARDVAASEVVDPVQLEAWIEGFRGDHYAAIAKASAQIDSASAYEGGTDPAACRFGKWLSSYQTKNAAIAGVMERASTPHMQFHVSIAHVQQALAKKDVSGARKILEQETRPAAVQVIDAFSDIEKEVAKARALYEQIQAKVLVDGPKLEATVDAALKKVVAAEIADSGESAEQAVADGRQARIVTLSVAVVGALGVLVLGAAFGAHIAKKLHAVVDAVGTGAAETASAATQVASASQSLAAGANEQASSLEETSASLIELSATTKRNADNATEVRDAATKARVSADASATQMARMNETMAAIKGASVDITKTLKTIDEIAFQTNILALNAAVEAARAGEAGAGFAVVADEVRALAQRAAAAAKETEERITAAVTRSNEGAELSQQVHDSLRQIQEQIHHLDQLVAEIATASIEQRNGFEQVSAAVAKIDQITQSNASNAEETASTSEELNAQVASLKDQTEILRTIVEGARVRGARPAPRRTAAARPDAHADAPPPAPKQTVRARRAPVRAENAAAEFEHFLSMDEPPQNGANGKSNGNGVRH